MRPIEFLFGVALLLYSYVIWWHKIKCQLKLWMVVLFGIGLSADITGTFILCNIMNPANWKLNAHVASGFVSLLIMAEHFRWAVNAFRGKRKYERRFNRFSIRAWLLWLAAFASGFFI